MTQLELSAEITPAAPQRQVHDHEIDSGALLGDAKSIAIRHGTQVYTLRLTRAGKLLLTK